MARLAPAVSALARQTMRTAFEDLERTITPADSRDFQKTTLQHVRAAALDIENQLAARQSLRNMRRLTPLLNGLEHYAKSVDILCNGTPYLAWIWAPLTLILRVASEYIEAFEQLMKGYKRIADALGRFEILNDAFIGNVDFQHTVAVFYADILQFHKHAYKFVRRSGWRLLFLTSWGRFQRRFETILDDLNRHGNLIDLEANARNIAEAREMRKDLRTWREEHIEKVQHDEEEQAAKQYRSIMSWLKIDGSEQLKIFESIAEEGSKHLGTCDWILKNQKIRSWLQPKSDTHFIWLQGNPGSGKSVLTTQIVNFTQAAGSFIICHVCTYSFATSTKYEHIIRSLLLQLLRRSSDLVAYVYQELVIGKTVPKIVVLEQLLQALLGALSEEPRNSECLWIVLDGLDECESGKQARVVSLMNQITSNANGGTVCKVLISSRSTPMLVKRLRRKQIVSLSDEGGEIDHAIKRYASQRLQSLRERLRQLELEPIDIEEIEDTIAKKANGMFLYAKLVLDYLRTNIFFSREELKESIDLLPETISEFYRKILTQILNHLDARSVERIRSVLGWVAFSKRPLRKLEFLSALSFSAGDSNVSRLVPQYILDICSPLVEERRDLTLSFIHVSVKEFLQTNSDGWIINEKNAYREHGVAALTCLLSGLEIFNDVCDEQTRSLRLVKGIHGFHVYATEYWTDYILDDAVETNPIDTSSTLFALASRLANMLDQTFPPLQPTSTMTVSDERLKALQQHEILYRHVKHALMGRSRMRLESELLQDCGLDGVDRSSERPFALDGVSTMLVSYQKSVEHLLNQDSCPGASAEELELFKSHFRTSAFTCRLRQCPRATLGFETEQLRREHEITHAEGFRCTFLGCQYPPYRSAQSLKAHIDRHHNTTPAWKSIRRINHAKSFNRTPAAVPLETQTSIVANNGNPASLNYSQNPQELTNNGHGLTTLAQLTPNQMRPSPPHPRFRDIIRLQQLDPLPVTMNNPNMQPNGMAARAPAGLGHFIQYYQIELYQQKIPPGWQQSTSPEQRCQLASQFFIQYRMLKPDISEVDAMRSSLQFETQNFLAAHTKDQYMLNIKQKLLVMTNARQQQLQRMQDNLGNLNNPINASALAKGT